MVLVMLLVHHRCFPILIRPKQLQTRWRESLGAPNSADPRFPGWRLSLGSTMPPDGLLVNRTVRSNQPVGFDRPVRGARCPSSDDLRQRPGLGNGGSGLRMEAMRPGRD